MSPEERDYFDEKFRGVHHRLTEVKEDGEKTRELADEARGALRELKVRMEEKIAAADVTHDRLREDCAKTTAAVAARVEDLEGDRKKVVGGVLLAIGTALLGLLGIGNK